MKYFILTSTYFDFDMFASRAEKDEGPRHSVATLAATLGAEIRQPDPSTIKLHHRIFAFFFGFPEHWGAAKNLINECRENDVIFCAGQDVGVPTAIYACIQRKKVRIAMSTMEPASIRFKIFMKLLRLKNKIGLYIVNDQHKASCLSENYGIDIECIFIVPEQTDEEFFFPAPSNRRLTPSRHEPNIGPSTKGRPLLASAGREQRDYKTLAAAIINLDIDLKVCAVSPNASDKQKIAMPDAIPANMEFQGLTFNELRNLYWDADIVVISMLRNQASAGLTVLMEAMACKRPIIITENDDLSKKIIKLGLARGAAPGDIDSLRSAIESILKDPENAEEMAFRAHGYFLENHTSQVYVQMLADKLRSMH